MNVKKKLIFDSPILSPYGEDIWELKYDWTVIFRGEYYRIPAGSITDGASIPSLLWIVCGHPLKLPRLYAALVHDYLYDGNDPEATRADADDLYRDMQIALGVSRVRAYIEWFALRLFGWTHWNGFLPVRGEGDEG